MLKMVCNSGEWRIKFDLKSHWYLWEWIYSCSYYYRSPLHRVSFLWSPLIAPVLFLPSVSVLITHEYLLISPCLWDRGSKRTYIHLGESVSVFNLWAQCMRDNTATTLIHTDQYLQWDHHLHIAAKYSIINTLAHRSRVASSTPRTAQNRATAHKRNPYQMQIPRMGFTHNGTQEFHKEQPNNNKINNTEWSNTKKGHLCILYTQGLCEGIKNICRIYGINTHFMGNRPL